MSGRLRCSICSGTEFVDAVDNEGKAYRGCRWCILLLPRAAVVDPPGDDPIALWREWCSRDITETDDGWASFTNRVHAMLARRGLEP